MVHISKLFPTVDIKIEFPELPHMLANDSPYRHILTTLKIFFRKLSRKGLIFVRRGLRHRDFSINAFLVEKSFSEDVVLGLRVTAYGNVPAKISYRDHVV